MDVPPGVPLNCVHVFRAYPAAIKHTIEASLRPFEFLELPKETRFEIYDRLFSNNTSYAIAPRSASFILVSPMVGRRTPIVARRRFAIALLYTCKQVNQEATSVLYRSNSFATNLIYLEHATSTFPGALPRLPLLLNLVTVFETTILVMPDYMIHYHQSLSDLAASISQMTALQQLRMAIAEFRNTQGQQIYPWTIYFIKDIENIILATPVHTTVRLMNGQEAGLHGTGGSLTLNTPAMLEIVRGNGWQLPAYP